MRSLLRVIPLCDCGCSPTLLIKISPITGGWGLHPRQVQPDGPQWTGSPLPSGPRHDPGPRTRFVYLCLFMLKFWSTRVTVCPKCCVNIPKVLFVGWHAGCLSRGETGSSPDISRKIFISFKNIRLNVYLRLYQLTCDRDQDVGLMELQHFYDRFMWCAFNLSSWALLHMSEKVRMNIWSLQSIF